MLKIYNNTKITTKIIFKIIKNNIKLSIDNKKYVKKIRRLVFYPNKNIKKYK
jgi:hypothetical protein